jgi:hypothetical protein
VSGFCCDGDDEICEYSSHFDQIPFCPYSVFCSYIKSCTCYYVARFSFSNFIISKYLEKKFQEINLFCKIKIPYFSQFFVGEKKKGTQKELKLLTHKH